MMTQRCSKDVNNKKNNICWKGDTRKSVLDLKSRVFLQVSADSLLRRNAVQSLISPPSPVEKDNWSQSPIKMQLC